jgi:hypothetical protein
MLLPDETAVYPAQIRPVLPSSQGLQRASMKAWTRVCVEVSPLPSGAGPRVIGVQGSHVQFEFETLHDVLSEISRTFSLGHEGAE